MQPSVVNLERSREGNELERLREEVRALAIANVHAAELMAELEEARHLEEKLRQRNHDLARAQLLEQDRCQVLEMVARREPEECLLEGLAKIILHQFPEARFSIFRSRGDHLDPVAHFNLPPEFRRELDAAPIAFGTPGCGQAALHAKPVFITSRELLTGHLASSLRLSPYTAAWSWPVIAVGERKVFGVIARYREEPELPNEAEVALMEKVANLAALCWEQRQLYEQLAYQAHYDTLTALPNRALFNERLRQALEAARETRQCLAVLWIDIDHFKQINDTLGHRIADGLLRETGCRLRTCVRAADTVARMVGDEFAVLLPDMGYNSSAMRVAEKVLSRLSAPFQVDGHQLSITASIGISIFPEHGDEPDTLVRNADIAMYSAKQVGRNTCWYYSPETDAQIRDRYEVERHLHRALERSELELYYQPQVDESRKILAVEALLRWSSAELGSVSPARFIPVAESSGLIIPIGRWVLEQASRMASRWHQQGHPIKVAVNVSPTQLARADFADQVADILRQTKLAPELLELELTESCILSDAVVCVRQLDKLRRLGMEISIDDFGTGYSSLSYLQSLPVSALKIDRSFIRDLCTESASGRLVEAMLQIASTLNLRVVAEGVETEAQRQVLQEMGCHLMQGFLLHKPMPLRDLEQLLRRQIE